MRIRNRSWRKGFGLGQIMATLLVVMPTLAFSVMFLFAYWNVMQIDYKLKLIANMAADFANSRTELRIFGDAETIAFSTRASTLCPAGTALNFSPITDGNAKDEISITVEYTTPATDTYMASKKLSTNIQTYSYHEQNMSITLTCLTPSP